MSETEKRYTISAGSAKAGKYRSEWHIDGGLFRDFDCSDVRQADVNAVVELDRGPSKIAVQATLTGMVTVECDRCLEDLRLPVEYSGSLEIRFGQGEYDGETMWIGEREDIDLAPFLYESVILSLPYRRVHPDGECDPEMLGRFRSVSREEYMDMAAVQSEEKGIGTGALEKLQAVKKKLEQ